MERSVMIGSGSFRNQLAKLDAEALLPGRGGTIQQGRILNLTWFGKGCSGPSPSANLAGAAGREVKTIATRKD